MRTLFLLALCALVVPVYSQPPPVHWWPCETRKKPLTAWERWLASKPSPKSYLLRRVVVDPSLTQPMATPSTPEDDPFSGQLTLIDQGHLQFGVSGGRGIDLRNWPRTLPELIRFIRWRNLFHLRNWIPKPQSYDLRMQNLIGGSLYFIF